MKEKILVVDDAPFIREVMLQILKDLPGFELLEACNGSEAIEAAKMHNPNYIFMDLVMPGVNGIEATEEIIKFLPQVKIIACSTVDDESMMLKALQAGCCNYIVKPFSKGDLVKVLQTDQKGT